MVMASLSQYETSGSPFFAHSAEGVSGNVDIVERTKVVLAASPPAPFDSVHGIGDSAPEALAPLICACAKWAVE